MPNSPLGNSEVFFSFFDLSLCIRDVLIPVSLSLSPHERLVGLRAFFL